MNKNIKKSQSILYVFAGLLLLAGFTQCGAEDIASFVHSMTGLPLLVVNTHGHPDHAGGNRYFDTCYAHPDDLAMAKHFSYGDTNSIPVREGYVFDLGGTKLSVIETPGHTKGSICLWDAAHKTLFTGDNNNAHVWLFLYESLPLETYLQTLKKLLAHKSDFKVLYPGHGTPLTADFLSDLAVCAQKILSGECKGTFYDTYPNARACNYNGALIAFNPHKLFNKN